MFLFTDHFHVFSIKSLFIFLTSLLILGCSSVPYPSPQTVLTSEERREIIDSPPLEGKGALYVVFWVVDELLSQTRIEGELVARVDYGAVRLDLLPGDYSIAGGYARYNDRNENWVPTTFRVEEGKKYYNIFGWQKKSGKTHTQIFDFTDSKYGGIRQLRTMPFYTPAVDTATLIPFSIREVYDDCLASEVVSSCQSLQEKSIYPYLASIDKEKTETILSNHARLEAEQRALEESLPPQLRRDKYMLQLTKFLKENNYEAALPVFEDLTNLGLPLDPSFNYFRGEALLKVNQKTEALKYLYDYVRNQGSSAKYYKQALELINEAETK